MKTVELVVGDFSQLRVIVAKQSVVEYAPSRFETLASNWRHLMFDCEERRVLITRPDAAERVQYGSPEWPLPLVVPTQVLEAPEVVPPAEALEEAEHAVNL